jgi:hypothetical protein
MTEYRIVSAGTERPMKYGTETGEEFACLRLQVGKRERLEMLRLSDAEALRIAADLVRSVQRRVIR